MLSLFNTCSHSKNMLANSNNVHIFIVKLLFSENVYEIWKGKNEKIKEKTKLKDEMKKEKEK